MAWKHESVEKSLGILKKIVNAAFIRCINHFEGDPEVKTNKAALFFHSRFTGLFLQNTNAIWIQDIRTSRAPRRVFSRLILTCFEVAEHSSVSKVIPPRAFELNSNVPMTTSPKHGKTRHTRNRTPQHYSTTKLKGNMVSGSNIPSLKRSSNVSRSSNAHKS